MLIIINNNIIMEYLVVRRPFKLFNRIIINVKHRTFIIILELQKIFSENILK